MATTHNLYNHGNDGPNHTKTSFISLVQQLTVIYEVGLSLKGLFPSPDPLSPEPNHPQNPICFQFSKSSYSFKDVTYICAYTHTK